MWSRIKLYVGAFIGLLIGALGFMVQYRTQQRDNERAERLRADHARHAEEQRREDERRINQAAAEQHDENELARSTREKDSNGLPAGPVGNHGRLRK